MASGSEGSRGAAIADKKAAIARGKAKKPSRAKTGRSGEKRGKK